ncbi:hypothetical protein V5799_029757 [Amblyomma americanum]|uniref:YqaJ viral recombinase domain-containing protein n=1 Tax=Amblyomma americanum TaxID=6943 RepID=A0AAQ4EQN3_AMBAM
MGQTERKSQEELRALPLPSWHEERRLRITSTKAHAIRTKRSDEGFQKAADSLCKTSSYTSAAMHYGIKTEATAREDLQRKLGIRIVQLKH